MNILFGIEVKIVEFIEWAYRSPQIMLMTLELGMVNNFRSYLF
jgi:hypothetical protein